MCCLNVQEDAVKAGAFARCGPYLNFYKTFKILSWLAINLRLFRGGGLIVKDWDCRPSLLKILGG